MKKITKELIEIYSDLDELDIKYLKTFVANDGREYDVHLLNSNNGQFIAKAIKSGGSLENEVRILNFLSNTNLNTSKLFLPYKQGSTYLLLKYINGDNLSEISDISKLIITKLANSLASLHKINVTSNKLPGVSDFDEWINYMRKKVSEREILFKELLDRESINKLHHLFEELILRLKNNPREIGFMHYDCYLDNFILESETKEVFIIDFAYSRVGDSLIDVAKLIVLSLSQNKSLIDEFLTVYKKRIKSVDAKLLSLYILFVLTGFISHTRNAGEIEKSNRYLDLLNQMLKQTTGYIELVCKANQGS